MAAFAVEGLAFAEVALRDRNHLSAKTRRRARRLLPQTRARNGNTELEADQVIRLVHGGVVAGRVGDEAVLVETAAHVLAIGGERHVDAPAQIAEHRPAVALEARHDFDLSAPFEHAAFGPRPQHAREIVDAAGWKRKAV